MTPLHPLIEATFTILDEPSGEASAVLRNDWGRWEFYGPEDIDLELMLWLPVWGQA